MYSRFFPESEIREILSSSLDSIAGRSESHELKLADFLKAMSECPLGELYASARAGLYAFIRARKLTAIAVPAFICTGVVDAIEEAGAKIVFYDLQRGGVEPEYKMIDVGAVDALLVAHYSGIPVDARAALKFSRANDLVLIEDCASGIGAKVNGEACGRFGDAVLYSFEESKLVGCFGGGALLWRDMRSDLEKEGRAQFRIPFALLRGLIVKLALWGPIYRFVVLPLHARQSSLTPKSRIQNDRDMPGGIASLANRLLSRLDSIIQTRREIAEVYGLGLREANGVELLRSSRKVSPAYTHFPVVLTGGKRVKVLKEMRKRGVDCGTNYPWLAQLVGREDEFPVTFEYCRSVLTLPISSSLTLQEAQDIVQLLHECVTSS